MQRSIQFAAELLNYFASNNINHIYLGQIRSKFEASYHLRIMADKGYISDMEFICLNFYGEFVKDVVISWEGHDFLDNYFINYREEIERAPELTVIPEKDYLEHLTPPDLNLSVKEQTQLNEKLDYLLQRCFEKYPASYVSLICECCDETLPFLQNKTSFTEAIREVGDAGHLSDLVLRLEKEFSIMP